MVVRGQKSPTLYGKKKLLSLASSRSRARRLACVRRFQQTWRVANRRRAVTGLSMAAIPLASAWSVPRFPRNAPAPDRADQRGCSASPARFGLPVAGAIAEHAGLTTSVLDLRRAAAACLAGRAVLRAGNARSWPAAKLDVGGSVLLGTGARPLLLPLARPASGLGRPADDRLLLAAAAVAVHVFVARRAQC